MQGHKHRWMEDFTLEDSRTHIKTSIEDSARYARLLALPESLLANMVLQIFPSHTHTHFVLHPASQEFCLPAWCSVPAGSSSWQVRPLCSWMDRVDVWVIKCACGAQHAANTLPVSVPVCVCAVWRRGPSSWRTSSRRAQSVCTALTPCSRTCSVSYTIFLPLCVFSCFLSYQTCLERESSLLPKDFSLAVLESTASESVPGSHQVSLFLLWYVRYLCNLQSIWPFVSNRPLVINTLRWPNAGNTRQ